MYEKHNKTNTRLYNIFRYMKARCNNPMRPDFKHYGGRGITICAEWLNSFEAFYNWAINNGYAENLTIDRIDVNGDYCPENCRWVTMQTQCLNRKSNRKITAFGYTYTISQWAQITGLKFTTIKGRLDRLGWSAEKALTTNRRKYKRGN